MTTQTGSPQPQGTEPSLCLGEQAAHILMMYRRKNPAMGGPSEIDRFNADRLVRDRWGLDPDMTVAELRKRLEIAERVEKTTLMPARQPSASAFVRGWDDGQERLLDWIKNGDD